MAVVTLERSQVSALLVDAQSINWTGVALPEEPELVWLENSFRLADWTELPLIATFEHPIDRNGMFPERLKKVYPLQGQRFTKRTYNCCPEPTIFAAIKALP
jgi:hypothetical protein